jgi:hypothetical protein
LQFKKLAAQVMSRFAKFSARWISAYGMTMGISDVTPSSILHAKNERKKTDEYK